MRRVWVGVFRIGAMFLLQSSCFGAAEADHGHAKTNHPAKYKVTMHVDGKHVAKKLDLSNEAHHKELVEALKHGHVENLVPDKPPEFLKIHTGTAIWTVVVFVLLLFILKKVAWGPMIEGLHKREESIRTALEDARRAKEEAEQIRAQLKKEMDQAHEKVREILEEARRDAQHTTDEMIAKAREEIQAERDRLRREIEMAKDQALQVLWTRAVELATHVAAKAIARQITIEDHQRLVEEAINELGMRNGAPS
ncbi:MAG: hypothetical protein KatS3mg105_4868 [Gemmatales bacterium]|nr:MAG: hypothetical protein KatS3mg105_4868 [Gemmatales bacterium]